MSQYGFFVYIKNKILKIDNEEIVFAGLQLVSTEDPNILPNCEAI